VVVLNQVVNFAAVCVRFVGPAVLDPAGGDAVPGGVAVRGCGGGGRVAAARGSARPGALDGAGAAGPGARDRARPGAAADAAPGPQPVDAPRQDRDASMTAGGGGGGRALGCGRPAHAPPPAAPRCRRRRPRRRPTPTATVNLSHPTPRQTPQWKLWLREHGRPKPIWCCVSVFQELTL